MEKFTDFFLFTKVGYFLLVFSASVALELIVYFLDDKMFWGMVGGSFVYSLFAAIITNKTKRWI